MCMDAEFIEEYDQASHNDWLLPEVNVLVTSLCNEWLILFVNIM